MFRRPTLLLIASVLLLCGTPGRAAGEEEGAAARLIKAKSGSIVSVRFVLQATM